MTNAKALSEQDLRVRSFVYSFFIDQARPPSVEETALSLTLTEEQAGASYRSLNEAKALFLEPGSFDVRMASPFSAVETGYRVRCGLQTYHANCAWDAFGIPAVLACDACIEAPCGDCHELLSLNIQGGKVDGDGEIIHISVPFRHWYDNLIHT